MAARAVTFMLLLMKLMIFAYCTFAIKKKSYINESACYSVCPEDKIIDERELFVCELIWGYKQSSALHMKSKGLLKLLVILVRDIGVNPGLCVTCTTCDKKIKRNQINAKCKTCGVYYHVKCTKENFGEDIYCRLCYIYPEENQYTNNDCYNELRALINRARFVAAKIRIFTFLELVKVNSQTKITDEEVQIQGYNSVRYDRKNGSGGGVYVYIRDDLNFQRRTDLESQFIEAVWIEIFIKNSRSILICITYRPPNSSKYLYPNLDNAFNDMLTIATKDDKEIILLGDMNCDYSKTSDNQNLKDAIKINGLKQMITEPIQESQAAQVHL